MSIVTFSAVVLASILLALLYLALSMLWPSYKSWKIQGSLVALARCLSLLNRSPLADGKIVNGGYLHDRFYRLAFMVLTHKINLKWRVLFTLNSGSDVERSKFYREMQGLEPESRESVISAISAIAKILWLRNPILFTLIMAKGIIGSRDFRKPASREKMRDQAIRSTESLALKGFRNRDYAFVQIRH